MDSSNAEKAFDEYCNRQDIPTYRELGGYLEAVGDEVAELTAENERLQAQIAKGGTIVQKAADLALTTPFSLQQATESLTWTTDVWHQFKKAQADRDDALKELAESRARFADSEARRAELEAVIEKARKHIEISLGPGLATSITHRILSASRSVVLEDRDREVAARAVETFAANLREWYPEDVFPKPTDENYHDLRVALARTNITLDRFSADLMRRAAGIAEKEAAAIRKGDTNA